MKKLENLTSDEKTALKVPLEQITPNTSVTVKDLRQIDKICTALEQEAATVEFEDADFEYLKKQFLAYKGWNPSADTRVIVIALANKLEVV